VRAACSSCGAGITPLTPSEEPLRVRFPAVTVLEGHNGAQRSVVCNKENGKKILTTLIAPKHVVGFNCAFTLSSA